MPAVSKPSLQGVLEHQAQPCELAGPLGAACRQEIFRPWPPPRKLLPPLAANSNACHVIHACGTFPKKPLAPQRLA